MKDCYGDNIECDYCDADAVYTNDDEDRAVCEEHNLENLCSIKLADILIGEGEKK